MPRISRSTTALVGVAALGSIALVGCSSSSNTTPSASPTSASPTESSASPSSDALTYRLASGSTVKIAGQGAGSWTSTGGVLITKPSGQGALAGRIEVAATGGSDPNGDWNLTLVSNGAGNVTNGTLVSPGRKFKVIGSTGKINYMTTMSGTTIVTLTAIPVQEGTETPTTMTFSVSGNKA